MMQLMRLSTAEVTSRHAVGDVAEQVVSDVGNKAILYVWQLNGSPCT